MSGRMDKDYFNGKQELAVEALNVALSYGETAKRLIESARYELPNLTDHSQIHEALRGAQAHIFSARRNFEKTRWADASTSLTFDDWLREHGYNELV